jgi:hypothetical protein
MVIVHSPPDNGRGEIGLAWFFFVGCHSTARSTKTTRWLRRLNLSPGYCPRFIRCEIAVAPTWYRAASSKIQLLSCIGMVTLHPHSSSRQKQHNEVQQQRHRYHDNQDRNRFVLGLNLVEQLEPGWEILAW